MLVDVVDLINEIPIVLENPSLQYLLNVLALHVRHMQIILNLRILKVCRNSEIIMSLTLTYEYSNRRIYCVIYGLYKANI